MTVHGTKGLEAPIVFLAEAGPYQPQEAKDRLVIDPETGLPFWRAAAAERDPESRRIAEAIRARQAAERWRLFYVALTRARDRLYVAGWAKRRATTEGSWHDLVSRGLRHAELEPGSIEGSLRLVRGSAGSEPAEPIAGTPEPAPAPAWLQRPPPAEPPSARLVQPSRETTAALAASSPLATATGDARLFGTALHRLLHEVAAQPPAERDGFLDGRLAGWPGLLPESRSELARQVRGVLELPELAPAFAPGSRSEQPIVGRVGDIVVAGQIDRFAVTDKAIYIVDFKSNRLPPRGAEAMPVAYLRQLAAYAELLLVLYPGRAVRAGIVWTAVPVLVPISETVLAAHRPGESVTA
jgi:ATP-dependent helicase/nuclease subunit A